MTEREKFEQWASMPPREWPIDRIPDVDESQFAGQYYHYDVEHAWLAWQARADVSTHKAIYEDEV